MSEMIRVGMADYKLCAPPDKISTLGLGSCMGVVIYDTKTKLCGMAHIMLPDSTKITHNQNRMKFADTCLLDMYHELLARGGLKENLRAKIAGGAKMFAHHSDNELQFSKAPSLISRSCGGITISVSHLHPLNKLDSITVYFSLFGKYAYPRLVHL